MAKKRKARRKHRKKRSILKSAVALVSVCVLLVIFAGCAGVAYIAYTAPPIDTTNIYSQIERTSYVYDKDGELLDTLHYEEDRKVVEIGEIPEPLRDAVVAIEDKTFYTHHGFNFKRMAGAVINRLLKRSSSISGTSTITQQLARNVYLSDIKSERTIKRKVTEMYYAWQLEQSLSKDDILEAYLNSIYLGYGNYGVSSAAKTYFSKDVGELTISECAALAALPQAPDEYALLRDEEGEFTTELKNGIYANDTSKNRRDLVLDLMAEQGYITPEAANEAKVDIASILNPDLSRPSSSYTYFTDYVSSVVTKDLVSELGMSEEEADRLVHAGGLSIFTTLDADVQKVINKEFSNDANFPSASEDPQASMVIAEVSTGKIIAMSGGRNGEGQRLFNRATSPRQPGSSIKPLSVYAAALQKSFECQAEGHTFPFTDYGFDKQGAKGWGDYLTAASKVTDERMVVNGNVWPQNYSRTFSGYKNFRTALQQSLNTCAVKIQLQVGSEYSINMLKKFGITTVQDDITQPVNDSNSAALALGAMTEGVTPLEMALAYTAFPNGGLRQDAVCYTRVEDANGKVILEKESHANKVMDEGVAWIMTDVLKSVVSRGIAGDAAIVGTQVGGKTGTTNDAYDIWFCGFTPTYSAALWIGTDHNVEMNATSSRAAALWSKVLSQIPGATNGEYKKQPDDVIYYKGEYFTKGTEVGAIFTKEKTRKSNNNTGSGTSSSGSSSGSSNTNRNEFVQNFTGGSSSSGSSGSSSGGSSGSSGASSRDEWLREWQNSN